MTQSDPSNELERAAQKHRDDAAAAASATEREQQGQAERERERERAVAEDTLLTSLEPEGGTVFIVAWGLLSAVVGVVGSGSFARTNDALSVAILVASSAAFLGGTLFAPFAVRAWLAKMRAQRLGALGYGLDAAHYRRLLSERRAQGRLKVQLRFAQPLEATAMRTAADAVKGWMPQLESAKWSGEGDTLRLCIESAELRTNFKASSAKSSGSFYYCSNAPLHRCLLEVLARVVTPLNAAHPVAKLEVDFTGEVIPYDKDVR